jgi:hypothetical protein
MRIEGVGYACILFQAGLSGDQDFMGSAVQGKRSFAY